MHLRERREVRGERNSNFQISNSRNQSSKARREGDNSLEGWYIVGRDIRGKKVSIPATEIYRATHEFTASKGSTYAEVLIKKQHSE